MPKLETIPKEDLLDEEGVRGEETEPISEEDAVSDKEKAAFIEMQQRLDKGNTSEDLPSDEALEKMIAALPDERQKEVIRRRFFKRDTLEQIGKDLGITRERVRQIESEALRSIRDLRKIEESENTKFPNLDKYIYHDISLLINRYLLIHKFYRSYIRFYGYTLEDKERATRIMAEALYGIIDYIKEPSNKDYLYKLDITTFNKIYYGIKTILDKEEYNNQDALDLKNIREKLEEEIKKAKEEKVKGAMLKNK